MLSMVAELILLLAHNDRIVAFIEAKAPSVDLDRHIGQVVKYAFVEGVDICVLTNGMKWLLYLPMHRGPFEERLFATLQTKQDPLEQLQSDLEAFLSKANLVDGTAQQKAEERWDSNPARCNFEEDYPRGLASDAGRT